MIFYFSILLILWIAGFLLKNKYIDLFCFILILLFTVFRGEKIGIDTTSYINYSITSNELKSYQYINTFLCSFKNLRGTYFLVFVYGLIEYLGFLVACRRFKVSLSQFLFFFVLLGYWNISLNIARQYCAIALMLIAYTYLFEEGWKKYLFFLITILACGFHNSCIIFMSLYFVRFGDVSKVKPYFIIGFISFLYILMQSQIYDDFKIWTAAFETTMDIDYYSDFFKETEVTERSIGGMIIDILTLAFNTFVLISLSRKNKTKECRIVLSLFFFAMIADVFFAGLYGSFGRFRYTLDIINIIAYIYYLKYKPNFIIVLAFLIVMVFSYYKSLYYDYYETIPYELNFWLI